MLPTSVAQTATDGTPGVDGNSNSRSSAIRLEARDLVRPSARSEQVQQAIAATDAANHVARYANVCPVDADVGTYGCRVYRPNEDKPEDDEERELTPGDVLRAVREMGMPALRVRVEPGDETLVNVETNFYAEPQPFDRSIELLGFAVDVQATPATYTWIHGDGTTARTTDPGSPYPDLDVTHRYREPSSGVSPRVDVTYQVRYRVDGGPWLPLSQTLTARGPASTLTVNEAAPVLTAP